MAVQPTSNTSTHSRGKSSVSSNSGGGSSGGGGNNNAGTTGAALRRPLSKAALPAALATCKIQSYTDTITYPNALSSSVFASSPLPSVLTASGVVPSTATVGTAPAAPASSSYGPTSAAATGPYGSSTGGGIAPSQAATGPASGIRTLAWSPLGNLIATADARVLRVWNPEKAGVRFSTELKIPPSSSSSSSANTGSAGGSSSGGGGSAGTFTTSSSRMPSSYGQSQHLTGTERVAWNPTREAELASVGSDGMLRFWDVRAKQQMTGEVKIGGEGFSLTFSNSNSHGGGDDPTVVVGRKDDTLLHISRRNLAVMGTYPQGVQTNQLCFSNSGRELLLTTGDSTVKVLEFPSMAPLHTMHAHTSSCYVVAACPRGRYVATGGSDALVTLWDTHDWACRHSLAECVGPIRSVSFSFDGSFLVAGSDEGAGLLVAHVESGEYIYALPTTHPVPCVAWHPSRYWIAYAGEPQGLRIVGAAGGPL